jgi:hypothetical protein
VAESPELNRIVSDLNDDRDVTLADSSATHRLDRWLAALVQQGGSDLLLVPNAPPCLRFEGLVRRLEPGALSGIEIEAAVLPALSSHALRLYRKTQIADSSYRIAGLGRFRINLHRERSNAAAAVRALPAKIPSLTDLHLPPSVEALAHLPRGLVLIGGPAGSGKTTTLSAIVNEINQHESRHILTIEDPIEYEHKHIHSIVEQVEIGTDALTSPPLCARHCDRRLTFSWSAKCATLKPCASPSPPPKLATWFSPLCTPPTLRPQSAASRIHFPSSARIRFARNSPWLSPPFSPKFLCR